MAVDFAELERRLVQQLSRVQSSTAGELRAQLGISQPTLSRLLGRMSSRVVVAGRARATRYAARRQAEDLPEHLPIYEIGPNAEARRAASLHAVLPEGYYVEGEGDDVPSAFHRDLPYYLHELRPAGFLGRLVPRQHPELGLPADARLWSSNDVLRYVSRFGWNLPGAFVVGDAALSLYLERTLRVELVELRERRRRYPELARDVLSAGTPGSSAAGEQAKFLATRAPGVDVLVKFSTQGKDARSRREADLLLAEHLAHRILAEHGQESARSELVVAEEQTFLEVERFDRLPTGGRRGVISLMALDAEYLGSMKSWTDSVVRLAAAGHVPSVAVRPTRIRELFGLLIGNTDMHPGNLAFISRGSRVQALAPSYDMLPMLFASTVGRGERKLALTTPTPRDAEVWRVASDAALEYWAALARESRLSTRFRGIALASLDQVRAWREIARRLPS
ncbi:MAG TPA: type II toxin-antitoxin system HipA family toxin YjjJ [Polyangiaceae bacterium]|nr:type II toxin-antitoxin system HipA family toxin YjjJ [Polyangiaceae bacterium]